MSMTLHRHLLNISHRHLLNISLLLSVFLNIASVFSSIGYTQPAIKLTIASTTSTANSGLMDHLLPIAEDALGIDIRLIAVGTGRALRLQEMGDVDAILVHDAQGERNAIAHGHAQSRRPVMQNQFVILGPKDDALLADVVSGVDALNRLSATGDRLFISRGDDSGTHRAEYRLWAASEQGKPPESKQKWYKQSGQGMGATLRIAVELQAYTLSDTGTWGVHGLNDQLEIKVVNDPEMANPYGYLVTNATRHPHTEIDAAERFGDWLLSPEGQQAILSFSNNPMALFKPIF